MSRTRRERDTWEIIRYDADDDAWFRSGVTYTTRHDAEQTAAAAVETFGDTRPRYIRTTRELDVVGLPEGPPPARKSRR